jgi:hypothetical protein
MNCINGHLSTTKDETTPVVYMPLDVPSRDEREATSYHRWVVYDRCVSCGLHRVRVFHGNEETASGMRCFPSTADEKSGRLKPS